MKRLAHLLMPQMNRATRLGALPLMQRSALDVTDRKAKARKKEVPLSMIPFLRSRATRLCEQPSLPGVPTLVIQIGAIMYQTDR